MISEASPIFRQQRDWTIVSFARPRKWAVVIGIPLLSCLQAKTYVVIYALPVDGG